MADITIAVDPASAAGDYTAKCEYRILADGRVRIQRMWIEPSTPRSRYCPCADPHNCTETVPGYTCRKGFYPPAQSGNAEYPSQEKP